MGAFGARGVGPEPAQGRHRPHRLAALLSPPLGTEFEGSNTGDFSKTVFCKNRASNFRYEIEKKNSQN